MHHVKFPSWSHLQAVSEPVRHIPLLWVQWKTPDDGQRNCPKHVEYHSKDKFEKLVCLVGFITRNFLPLYTHISLWHVSALKGPSLRSTTDTFQQWGQRNEFYHFYNFMFFTSITILDVCVTVHRVKFLIIKPTRWTKFSNLFWGWTVWNK